MRMEGNGSDSYGRSSPADKHLTTPPRHRCATIGVLRAIPMANPFVHVELHTGDLAKAKAFYSQLFGWTLQDLPTPKGTYRLIEVGDATGGGMMTNPEPGSPPHWLA